jgi:hypothetical protein
MRMIKVVQKEKSKLFGLLGTQQVHEDIVWEEWTLSVNVIPSRIAARDDAKQQSISGSGQTDSASAEGVVKAMTKAVLDIVVSCSQSQMQNLHIEGRLEETPALWFEGSSLSPPPPPTFFLPSILS